MQFSHCCLFLHSLLLSHGSHLGPSSLTFTWCAHPPLWTQLSSSCTHDPSAFLSTRYLIPTASQLTHVSILQPSHTQCYTSETSPSCSSYQDTAIHLNIQDTGLESFMIPPFSPFLIFSQSPSIIPPLLCFSNHSLFLHLHYLTSGSHRFSLRQVSVLWTLGSAMPSQDSTPSLVHL